MAIVLIESDTITLQMVDNTVWSGAPADPNDNSVEAVGIRQLLQAIKEDPGVEATTIGTAGASGYDGFTYILVL